MLLLMVSGIGGVRAVAHVPQYDDAYNASIAKNLAVGYGYASSYDVRVLFNPQISTGPTLILPAAGVMRLFGVHYWIPALVSLLVSCLAAFVFFYELHRWHEELNADASTPRLWEPGCESLAIAFSLVVMLLPELWGFQRAGEAVGMPVGAPEFVGEVPAATLIAAGAALLFSPRQSHGKVACGALSLGLAISSKVLAAIVVVPVILIFLGQQISSRQRRWRTTLAQFRDIIAGVGLPSAVFQLSKLLVLGSAGFHVLMERERGFFLAGGSGLAEMANTPRLATFWIAHINRNLANLSAHVGGPAVLLGLGVGLLVIFVLSVRAARRGGALVIWQGLGMMLGALACIVWWLAASGGWIRRAQIGLVLLPLAAMPMIVGLCRRWAAATLLVVAVVWATFGPFKFKWLGQITTVRTQELENLLTTASFLERQRRDGYTLLGCGWWANRRLEFVMKETENFRNCHKLVGATLGQKLLLVKDASYWDWDRSPVTAAFEKRCNRSVFSAAPFFVFSCAPVSETDDTKRQ